MHLVYLDESGNTGTNLGDQYALISYVTSAAREPKILDAAAGIVLRLKPELGVLLLRNILQKQPKFATNKKNRRIHQGPQGTHRVNEALPHKVMQARSEKKDSKP